MHKEADNLKELLASPSATREVLEKYGIHAKKKYGQNFLVDSRLNGISAIQTHGQLTRSHLNRSVVFTLHRDSSSITAE